MQDKILQTDESFKKLLSEIKYLNFEYMFKKEKDVPYLQIEFDAPCNNDPTKIERQYCRKWVLQYTMCDTEVVNTAYLATERAMIHEMKEQFMFMGEAIFNPHNNVKMMVEFRKQNGSSESREPLGE